MGGMTQAVDSGWAKLKIEAAAAEKQARIDSGQDVIVGVNKYKLKTEDPIEFLEVDNVRVREGQIKMLAQIKASRDTQAVNASLEALTQAAQSGVGNLLELSVKAMRLRATVGEVSDALEKVYGRHRADLRCGCSRATRFPIPRRRSTRRVPCGAAGRTGCCRRRSESP